MLYLAVPAESPVEGVVFVAGENQVLGVDRAAEEFDAVIGAVVNLNVINSCTAAYALEGDTIQLVGRGDVLAWVFYDDIAEYTAAVCCNIAAVFAGGTFPFKFA